MMFVIGWSFRVAEEGKEAEESLLVGVGSESHIGCDQVVDNAPEIRLEQLPSVLNKTLTFIPQTLLRGKLESIHNWVLFPKRRVKLVKLAVSFKHIPLCVSDSNVNLQVLR